jgi:NADH:ubiquinone oxidoreductase subunit F (NADH-binding)/NADH:ubiquinone oxidoreductase subunit E
MSKNLSALSFRRGLVPNLFERMVEAAEAHGTAEAAETVHALGKEFLFGDAITLGAVSFYDFLKKENEGKKVFLCNGSACLCAGTQDKLHHRAAAHFPEAEIGHICCLGRCHEGGAFQYEGKNYSGQSDAALETLFTSGEGDAVDRYEVVSARGTAILTAPFPGIDEYYAPFVALIQGGDRDALAVELKESGLRGRGGAGFPLGFKWAGCRAAEGAVKYIVCNADEGDPGAYIDKYLMEERPHSVLLGMMVAGWYAGANTGVLYIRAEYPDSLTRINEAISDLHRAGLLGENIRGTGFDFHLKTIKGAGAYICGEETALLASIEGQRPEVRTRPPFPTVEGLFRKPTIVNNVETFANLHAILTRGGKGYAAIGTPQSTGPKLLSLDSHFRQARHLRSRHGHAARGRLRDGGRLQESGQGRADRRPPRRDRPGRPDRPAHRRFRIVQEGRFPPRSCRRRQHPRGDADDRVSSSTSSSSPPTRAAASVSPAASAAPVEKSSSPRRGPRTITKSTANCITDLLDTMEQTSLCALGGGVPLPIKNALKYFEGELAGYFSEPVVMNAKR